MLLTRECDYAVRLIRCLANREKKSVQTICDSEYIPVKFAYKILKKLERAGIVRSIRGTNGGYQLMKPVDCITLYEIVNAVDDSLLVNECLQPSHICPHNADGKCCRFHQEFGRIQEVLVNALSANTIDKFINT